MKSKTFFQKNISIAALCSFVLGAVCGILKLACLASAPFADFFNRYVASLFRAALAHLTAFLPFSLAETVVLCAIPFAILYFVWCVKVAAKRDTLTRQIFNLLALMVLLGSLFVLTLGTGYDTTPLEDKMDLSVCDPSEDELYVASVKTLVELNRLERMIDRGEDGAAPLPYSFDELVDKLNAAYDTLYAKYDFISPLHTTVKQVALSKPLTYTHLSGMYTFWSGEANVNVNYPDYIIAYTTAHEMAHQRGIAPEDEANFIAFLACIASEDPYIRYAGYANILDYLASALYEADPERYTKELLIFYPDGLHAEYRAYAKMFTPYRDSTASEISGAVNDAYLKTQGQTEGTKSYGLVVDLAVAYFKTHEN